MRDGSLELVVVTTKDAFSALAAEWDAAFTPLPTVFLEHAWLSLWLDTYGKDSTPRVLAARSAGELVAAMPLVRQHDLARRRLSFMGSGPLTPNHLDVVARPEYRDAALRVFADALITHRSEWDVLDFDRLPCGGDAVQAIRGSAHDAGLISSLVTSAICPYAALPDTYEQYLGGRPARLRRTLRSHGAKLKRDFPDARFHQAMTAEEVERILGALERLHQARWEARGHAGSFADPRFGRFLRTYATIALRRDTLRLHSLNLNDEIIGVICNFRTRSGVEFYTTAFDAAWSGYSPGALLMAHAIQASIEEGAAVFDFLEGTEEYKGAWSTSHQNNVALQVYNKTAAGMFARFQAVMHQRAVGTARHLLPESLRLAVRRRLALLRIRRSA